MTEEIERDAGFCSGEDLEDPLEAEDDLHSPTDVSEDSVEVKVLPISLRNIKNKRKCAEPRKVASEEDDVLPPYKKRRHFVCSDSNKKPVAIIQDDPPPRPSSVTSLPGGPTVLSNPRSSPGSPFRPWSQPTLPPPSTPQEAEQLSSQRLLSRCSSGAVSSPSPPPSSYPPSRITQISVPRRCQSASSPTTSELQSYNDRVPLLHHQQEEPLALVLKNSPSSEDDRIPLRRERRVLGSQVTSTEIRIPVNLSEPLPHSNRLRFDVPGKFEDVKLFSVSERNLIPIDRYGVPNPQLLQERPSIMPQVFNRPGEAIVRNSSNNISRTRRFEAVDFTQGVARRTLSECEDRSVGEVEDLSSGLKHATSNGKFSVESLLGGARESKRLEDSKPGPSSIASTSSNTMLDQQKHKQTSPNCGQQRNYKNMTRERRIEANARERTRVHTISAAFDKLRQTVPCYSHNQKLSKLSVLRIACSYILTLSRVAGADYSADNSEPSLADCVNLVSRTIQTEGKLRRKKDD